MKYYSLMVMGLVMATAANAQTTTPTTAPAPATGGLTTSTTVATEVVIPEHLKGLTTETLRPEHSFPILGSYKATGNSTADITVTLDATNKGIVWIEGLPQGRFKAMMRKAPSTYKVPAQTSESGKQIAEGTLFLNPESKEVMLVLGRSFNDADPSATLTISSKKSKAWKYTGVKADATTSVAPAPMQQ